MNFEIAKAIRIANHKFDTPIYCSMKMSVANTVGEKSIRVAHVEPTAALVDLRNSIKRGDILTLTSSNSSYEGQTEQVIVERSTYQAPYYYIGLQNALTKVYDVDDPVVGYGSGWPEGWNHGSAAYNKYSFTTIMPYGKGFSDNFAFSLTNTADPTTAQSTAILKSDAFEFDEWPEYSYYRAGFWMKQEVSSGLNVPRLIFYVNDGITSNYRLLYTDTDVIDWTEQEIYGSNFLSSPNLAQYLGGVSNRTTTGFIQLDILSWNKFTIFLDDFYLEHIRGVAPCVETSSANSPVNYATNTLFNVTGDLSEFTVGSTVNIWGWDATGANIIYDKGTIVTDGIFDTSSLKALAVTGLTVGRQWGPGARIEQANNGFWTFTEYPDLGSVVPTKTENIVKYRNSNNSLRWANVSGWGERSSKYSLSMSFSNVPYTFYKKLRVFEEYCLQGGVVNLHLKENVPEIHQGFLQGLLSLTPAAKSMWNRQNCSFQLTLEEI